MSTLTDTALRTFTVDPSHSRAGFSVRHMGFSRVRGSFQQFEATVRMAPGDLSSLEAEATMEAVSIDTRDEKRDAHLRSEDFFQAETHPQVTFRTTGVRDVNGERFTLLGDLTMRGVTRPVALDAVFLGEGTDPWGGTRRLRGEHHRQPEGLRAELERRARDRRAPRERGGRDPARAPGRPAGRRLTRTGPPRPPPCPAGGLPPPAGLSISAPRGPRPR